jgi:molecular chaperone DnaJ
MGDIFGDFFGGRRSSGANSPQRGANVRTSVRLTFEEAIFGCEKEITVNFQEECPSCHGTGAKPGTSPEECPTCHGKGRIVQMSHTVFGTMQNVQTCPNCRGTGKIVKEKCPTCYGTGYTDEEGKRSVFQHSRRN